MALFPVSPTNGQQTTVNNITYTYDSTQTAWVRTSTGGNISAGNGIFSGNLAVGSNANVGNLNAALNIFSNNLLIQGDGTDGYIRPTNAGSKLFIGANNNNYMTINAGGYVGIGGAPNFKLDVFANANTTTDATLRLYNSNTGSNAAVGIQQQTAVVTSVMITGQAFTTVGTTTAHPVRFISNNATTMYLAANNNVGIGTSTPASKIDVRSGDITVSRTAAGLAGDAALYFGNGNNNYIFSGDASNIMAFAVNGSERVRVDVNGNVGIGNTAPTDKLSVNGNVSANYFIGNGITNGTSNIVVAASGNVTISSAGNLNRFTVTGKGANVTGNLYQTSGSVTLNGIVLANTIYTYYTTIYGPGGSLAFSDTGNGSTRQYNVYNGTGNVFTIDQNGTSGIWRFYGSNGAFASNTVVSTNNFISGVTTNITANGSTQSTATAMTKDINVVSTVLTGNGVALPTAVAGYRISIINTSANALNVYPLDNGIINALGANNAYSLAANARLQIVCTSSTTAPGGQWYTL